MSLPRTLLCAAVALFTAMAPVAAPAQGLFKPAVKVNNSVITEFEISQRARLLGLLRAPGDPQTEARKGLIDERLQSEAAARAGIKPTPEDIQAGMEEFAARASLSAAEFVKAIGQAGVDEQTFRDFVSAGLAWRQLVRSRFASKVRISESDIDKASALQGNRSELRVLMSEIILPAPPPRAAESRALAERLSATLKSEAAFAAAARQYSFARTRSNGGKLPWTLLSALPPQLAPIILALKPGQVTQPIVLSEAVALFQLRALEEVSVASKDAASVDYAQFLVRGDTIAQARATAKSIEDRVDTCNDLYGVLRTSGTEKLERTKATVGSLPQDVALELAKLDSNEVSTDLTRGGGQSVLFLMLCQRGEAPVADAREGVRTTLVNQRLASFANNYLAELRAAAIIKDQ